MDGPPVFGHLSKKLARIKCNAFPDAYLCNANGSYADNNQVYMWPKQVCTCILPLYKM